jgi:hypothetical protein
MFTCFTGTQACFTGTKVQILTREMQQRVWTRERERERASEREREREREMWQTHIHTPTHPHTPTRTPYAERPVIHPPTHTHTHATSEIEWSPDAFWAASQTGERVLTFLALLAQKYVLCWYKRTCFPMYLLLRCFTGTHAQIMILRAPAEEYWGGDRVSKAAHTSSAYASTASNSYANTTPAGRLGLRGVQAGGGCTKFTCFTGALLVQKYQF